VVKSDEETLSSVKIAEVNTYKQDNTIHNNEE